MEAVKSFVLYSLEYWKRMILSIVQWSLFRSTIWMIICFVSYQSGSIISQHIPKLKQLPTKTLFDWKNRYVSIFHASIMSIITLYYWVFINPSVKFTQYLTTYQSFVVDMMMGYLWFDLIFEVLRQPDQVGSSMDIIGHHIIGLLSHYSTRLSNNGAAGFYCMMIFIAEISTPFLHLSWLLHQLNLRGTTIFKVLVGILVVTFFFCRYLLGPYVVYHMLVHRDKWEEGKDHNDNNNNHLTIEVLYWGNVVVVIFFALLNIYWFHKLIATVLGSKSKKEKS